MTAPDHPPPLLVLTGAGLPPWIWDDMRAQLDPKQQCVVASRPTQADKADLEGYAIHALAEAPEGEFTIVGHSLGAVVGLKVIDFAPDRVVRFLAVAGVVPPPGGSFISAMPFPNRRILDLVMRFGGTRPPDKAIRSTLAGIEPGLVEQIIAEFTPEPRALFRQRLDRTPRTVQAGYLHTSQDRELPERLQGTFAKNLCALWTRTLPTGHMPMLEDPAGVAEAIAAFQNSNE